MHGQLQVWSKRFYSLCNILSIFYLIDKVLVNIEFKKIIIWYFERNERVKMKKIDILI